MNRLRPERIPLLCLLLAMVAGCAAPNPRLELGFAGAELAGDNAYIGTRVRERAVTLRFAARMRGLESKDIPIRVYTTRNSRRELTAELHWKPDAGAEEWQWVPVLIPFSRLPSHWSVDVNAYAVSPDSPNGYYDRANLLVDFYKLYGGLLEGLWRLESFEDNADLGSGQRGVRASFQLEAWARQSRSFRPSLVVLNTKTLQSLRVAAATPSFSVGGSPQVFGNIRFQVRYSDIAKLLGVAEGDDLIFVPVADWNDGKRTENLYIDGYAFDNPGAVLHQLETARGAALRDADNLEQTLKVLQQAGH